MRGNVVSGHVMWGNKIKRTQVFLFFLQKRAQLVFKLFCFLNLLLQRGNL